MQFSSFPLSDCWHTKQPVLQGLQIIDPDESLNLVVPAGQADKHLPYHKAKPSEQEMQLLSLGPVQFTHETLQLWHTWAVVSR